MQSPAQSGPTAAPVTGRPAARALADVMAAWPVFVQVVRPMTLALILVQAGLCLAWFGAAPPPLTGSLATVVALACWYAHAVILNDLTDRRTDRINLAGTVHASERPLVNGSASAGQLRALAVVLVLLTIVVTSLVSPVLLVWLVPMFALNVCYSVPPIRLTGRGGLAQLVLPVGYVVIPAGYAWALAGYARIDGSALAGMIGLYLLFCGRLMTKDLRDVVGDRAVAKRTFVVRHGVTTTVRVGAALTTGGVAALVVAQLHRTGAGAAALALGAVGVAVVAVTWWSAAAISASTAIAAQVSLAAIAGRAATGLVFCLLVAELTAHTLTTGRVAVLVLGSAAVFAAGCWLFADQRRAVPGSGSRA